MLGLIRLLGMLLGGTLALVFIVAVPSFGLSVLWEAASTLTFQGLQALSRVLPPQGVLMGWAEAIASGLYLGPIWKTLLWWNAYLLAVAGTVLLLVYLVTPDRMARWVTGASDRSRVKNDNEWQLYLDKLAVQYHAARPRLMIEATQSVRAYCYHRPGRRPVVVASAGLVYDCPANVVSWVLAHEFAHLRFRDTSGQLPWLVMMRSLLFLRRLHIGVLAVISRLTRGWGLLWYPIVALSWLLSATGQVGFQIGGKIFKLVDAFVSRKMEYRADHFAAVHVGPQPGIALFKALKTQFEPGYDWYASHPSLKNRIRALERMK